MAEDISTTAGQKPVEDWSLPAIEPAAWPVPAHWHVFPCVPNEKRPLTPNGVLDATNDPAQIAAWREQWPDANWAVACGPSGLAVADIDGPVGEASWSDFERVHGGSPATLTVRTPRGGRHLYFAGEARNSAGTLGPKLDVRGTGGYVLLPGSAVDGKPYTVATENPIAALPYDLTPPKRERKAADPNLELDTPAAVFRAKEVASRAPEVTEGSRNDTAYRLGAELCDVGVSEGVALGLAEEWNARLAEPLDQAELELAIWSGFTNRDNDPGCYAPDPAALDRVATKALAYAAEHPTPEDEDRRGRLWSMAELDDRPSVPWLIDKELRVRGRAMLYGPYNQGKTFVTLAYLLPLCNHGLDIVYVAGEGEVEDIRDRRARAWAKHMEQTAPGSVAKVERHFFVFDEMPMSNAAETTAFCDEVKAKKVKPAVVVIDTYSIAMAGRNPNQDQDVSEFLQLDRTIRRELRAARWIVHHSGLEPGRPKGNTNLPGQCDTTWELAGENDNIITIKMGRQRDAKKSQEPITYRLTTLGETAVAVRLGAEESRKQAKVDGPLRAVRASFVEGLGQMRGSEEVRHLSLARSPLRLYRLRRAEARRCLNETRRRFGP